MCRNTKKWVIGRVYGLAGRHFWDVTEEAGYHMDIASPSGGYVPLDPESLIISEVADTVGIKGHVSKRYKEETL